MRKKFSLKGAIQAGDYFFKFKKIASHGKKIIAKPRRELKKAHANLMISSKKYNKWHQNPHHQKVHWATLVITIISFVSFLATTIFPLNNSQAASYTKTWSSSADFASGTNSHIDTANDEVKLSKTSTQYSEDFSATTYKDAATTASWASGDLTITPSTGTSSLSSKWRDAVGNGDKIYTMAEDTANNLLYYGGYNGSLGVYNETSNTFTDLTLKITSPMGRIYSLVYDSHNAILYVGGASFGAFAGGSDPANGTWIDLSSKSSDTLSFINTMSYDPTNYIVYVGGNGTNSSVNMGAFAGGSDPANGTWTSLDLTFSPSSMAFDTIYHFLYIGGSSKSYFIAFNAPANPSTGTFTSQTGKVTGYASDFAAMTIDTVKKNLYFGGGSLLWLCGLSASPASGSCGYVTNPGVSSLAYNGTGIYIGGGSGALVYYNPNTSSSTTYTSALTTGFGDATTTTSAMIFSSNGSKLYLGGSTDYLYATRFGTYSGPGGTVTNLSSNIITSGPPITKTAYDSVNHGVYLGGYGRLAYYDISGNSMTDLTSKISGSYNYGSNITSLGFDSTNGVLYLSGGSNVSGALDVSDGPAGSSFVNLTTKFNSTYNIASMAFDPINNYLYCVASNPRVFAFNGGSDPANGTYVNLTAATSFTNPTTVAYDSNNNNIYIGGTTGQLKVLPATANPATAAVTNLTTKVSSWSTKTFSALAYDTTNNVLYMGTQNSYVFGALTNGTDPANGTFSDLTSKISTDWSTTSAQINQLLFADSSIYILGYTGSYSERFGKITVAATPSSGTWTNLSSTISSSFASGSTGTDMIYFSTTSTFYLAGKVGQFASYQAVVAGEADAISTKINTTASTIIDATLTATASAPATTTITYYLSNDGGSTWHAVTSGQAYAFAETSNDLRWKIHMECVDSDTRPSISALTIDYHYFANYSGSLNLTYDAGASVSFITLSWNHTIETNTTLTFKVRSAATSEGLSSAAWSDAINYTAKPVDLQSLGVVDNNWVEIELDLATTDGLETPVVSDMTLTYASNFAPEVQNVTASQSTDGTKIVTIDYEARDTDTTTNPFNPNQVSMSFQYSFDGSTWSDCETVTGDGLKDITDTFSTLHASWDIGQDLPDQYSTSLLIRAAINDNELIHSTDSSDSSAITVDTKNPVLGTIGSSSGIQAKSGSVWTNTATIPLTFSATDDTALTMEVANQLNFVDNFEAYATSKANWSLTAGDGNKTVGAKYKDNFGNTTTATANILLDTTPPGVPQNVGIYDTSEPSLSRYALTIIWDPIEVVADFDHYAIERSVNGGAYSSLGTATIPVYTDQSLDASKTYSYQIKSVDTHENSSNASATVSLQPNAVDTTGPVITGGVPSVTPNDTTAVVTWNTDEPSDSYVEFGKTNTFGSTQGVDNLVMSHEVSLVGLSPETTYYYRVKSRDASGNQTTGLTYTFTTLAAESEVADTTAPVITSSSPEVTVSNNSATINWTTDENADSFVAFGKTTSYGTLQGDDTLTKNHSVTLNNLSATTLYHFKVKSRDASGNQAASADYTFATTADPAQAESDSVTLTGATVQKPGAAPEEVTIIWTTDTYTSSQVLYGKTESLGETTQLDATLNKTHYVQLQNLDANTKYYYRAKSVDTNGNIGLTEIKYFVTSESTATAPSISAVEVSDITLNSAIISWESTVVTTSIVEYGADLNYGSTLEDASLGSTTRHMIKFKNLQSGTKYHFRVSGRTARQNTVHSDDYVFTTNTTPTISDISVKDISSDKATIVWTTNVPADSYVDYGQTKLDQSQGRSESVKEHAITLINLQPATQYIFKIKSRDVNSNQVESTQANFKTIIDTAAPTIKDLKSETSIITDTNGVSKAQAIISWSTSEPSTSQIRYAQGVKPGREYPMSTTEDASLSTSHVVIISNLKPSAAYHLKIVSKDSSGNIGTSDDYTVLTQKQDTSLVQYIVQILEQRFSWLKHFGIFN